MTFAIDGYEILEDFVSDADVSAINHDLDGYSIAKGKGGIRHIDQKIETVHDLVSSQKMLRAACRYLSGAPAVVRVILFDKTPDNNWQVPWHQDKTVAVSARVEIQGWGPWSIKAGVHHVRPPVAVLEEMVTFRIHLDEASPETGCLRLIPGSQRVGILSTEKVQAWVNKGPVVNCSVSAGAALVMRPLVLHASKKATRPTRRRVLHVEYSSYPLPSGLHWG